MTHLCVLHSVNCLLESPNVNSQLVNDGPEALDVLGVFGHLLLEPCAVTIPGFQRSPIFSLTFNCHKSFTQIPGFQLDFQLLTPHDQPPILLQHPVQSFLIVDDFRRREISRHVLNLVAHLPDEGCPGEKIENVSIVILKTRLSYLKNLSFLNV